MDEVRAIITISIETEVEEPQQTTDYDPNYFAVYISGIDIYGGVNAKSRSDVNIHHGGQHADQADSSAFPPKRLLCAADDLGGVRDKLTQRRHLRRGCVQRNAGKSLQYGRSYYLRMNFSGFINIIDALGGMDVYSSQSFSAGGYPSRRDTTM